MIRKATAADVPAIVEMSKKFYSSTDDAGHVPMCEETVANLAAMLAESHIMFIAEVDGKAVGMIGAYVAPGMFNAAAVAAHEVVWYVDESARSSGVGRALLTAADNERRARGCWKFEKATLATSPKFADDILISSGFVPSYKSFMKVD